MSGLKKTSEKYVPKVYQMSMFGQEDFLVKMSQWQGKGLYGERTGLFFEFVRLLRERGDNKPLSITFA